MGDAYSVGVWVHGDDRETLYKHLGQPDDVALHVGIENVFCASYYEAPYGFYDQLAAACDAGISMHGSNGASDHAGPSAWVMAPSETRIEVDADDGGNPIAVTQWDSENGTVLILLDPCVVDYYRMVEGIQARWCHR